MSKMFDKFMSDRAAGRTGVAMPRRRRRAKTQRIVDIAYEVLSEYRPMTVRQVYYQLVARHIIENKRSQYQAVSVALRDARKFGEIPWEWIEDRLRRPRKVSMWSDLAEFAVTAVRSYRRDVWATQDHYVECLTPDTPVVTSTGMVPIVEIKKGQEVLTQDGTFQQVTMTRIRPFEGELVEIRALGMLPFRTTPNHPIFCFQKNYVAGGEPHLFMRADEVTSAMRLLIPRMKKTTERPSFSMIGGPRSKQVIAHLDENMAALIGTYLAEGCIRLDQRTTQFSLAEDRTEMATLLHTWANEHGLNYSEASSPGTRVVYIYGKSLAQWLKEEFGSGAFNKRLPQWFMILPKDLQMIAMEAYFRGDGTFKSKSRSAILAATRSQNLAYQIQLVLVRNGYGATLCCHQDHDKPIYTVNISGAFGEKLATSWGINLPPKNYRYNHVQMDDDYAYYPVRTVKGVPYEGPVVNLSVEGTQTYCIPATLHNCWLEKDALSGLFEDVLRPYGVTLNVGRGYDGWSSIRNAAMRYLAWSKPLEEEEPYPDEVLPKKEDSTKVLNEKLRGFVEAAEARRAFAAHPVRPRPVTILYFGDFDPSGRDMVRSLKERINFFGTYPFITISALTEDDITTYDLPPDFAKRSDSRSAAFIAQFGDVSVELDALPVKVLLARLENSVRKIMDLDALQDTLELEQEDKGRITLEWRGDSDN